VLNLDGDGDGFGGTDDSYYTGSGDRGTELRFALPEGTYRAIMFLGSVDGLNLLAVGVATALTGDGAPPPQPANGVFEITSDITTITFTVSALTSDIDPVSGDSAFALTGPTGTPSYAATAPKGYTALVNGDEVPYFHVPSGVDEAYDNDSSNGISAVQGTFTYSGFPAEFTVIDSTPTYADVVLATGAADWLGLVEDVKKPMTQTIGLAAHDSVTGVDLAPISVTGEVAVVTLKPNAVDGEPSALELTFVLKTPATPGLRDGFVKIQFSAGVQAFKNGAAPTGGNRNDRGAVWRIANGYNAGALDLGGTSTGRNILLLVGDQELVGSSYIIAELGGGL
jgi:hypothetical protein